MKNSEAVRRRSQDRASGLLRRPATATVVEMPAGRLAVKRLRPSAILPARGSQHAAGLDIFAAEDRIIRAKTFEAVATGIAIALPADCVGLVWPRSGLAARHGIDTLAGVIDSDYRGEIKIVLMNHGTMDYTVKAGDRIAQLLIQKIEWMNPVEMDALPESVRGGDGFGSSGH